MANETQTKRLMIHALLYGRALCGRKGIPATWAPHEKWIRVKDWQDARGAHEGELCPQCSAAIGGVRRKGI